MQRNNKYMYLDLNLSKKMTISLLFFKKIISGAYTLGVGFDIKYENSESSMRKSVIRRYCNYQKL